MNEFHVYLYGQEQQPLESSFEAAQLRLEQLDSLYFEPDGSFAWNLPDRHQLFGMLYDDGDRIRYCEIRGRCQLPDFQRLLAAITGDDSGRLTVLRLPEQRLQKLQSFEVELWGSSS